MYSCYMVDLFAWSSNLQRITAFIIRGRIYDDLKSTKRNSLATIIRWIFRFETDETNRIKNKQSSSYSHSHSKKTHKRINHIAVRLRRIRQCHVLSDKQLADMLIKPLPWSTISRCRIKIKMMSRWWKQEEVLEIYVFRRNLNHLCLW